MVTNSGNEIVYPIGQISSTGPWGLSLRDRVRSSVIFSSGCHLDASQVRRSGHVPPGDIILVDRVSLGDPHGGASSSERGEGSLSLSTEAAAASATRFRKSNEWILRQLFKSGLKYKDIWTEVVGRVN